MSDAVLNLTAETFDAAITEAGSGKILVDFWADWCGPCVAMAPLLDEIATDFPEAITIAKINADEHQSIGLRYQVMSLPTMLLFENGEITQRITGGKSKTQIMEYCGL